MDIYSFSKLRMCSCYGIFLLVSLYFNGSTGAQQRILDLEVILLKHLPSRPECLLLGGQWDLENLEGQNPPAGREKAMTTSIKNDH